MTKVYKIIIIIIFILLSFLPLLFTKWSVYTDIFFFIYIPIVLGAIFQDIYLRTSFNTLLNKSLIFSLLAVFWCFLGVVAGGKIGGVDLTSFLALNFMLSIFGFCVAYYIGERKKYVGMFSLENYIVQNTIFLYCLSIILTLSYFRSEDIVSFFVYVFLNFSLFSLIFTYFLYRFIKYRGRALGILFNIGNAFLTFLLGIYYFFSPFFQLLDINKQASFGSFNIFADFFIVGVFLGFLLQSILMLGWYFPGEHQRDEDWGLQYANKRFLERIPQNFPSLRSILLFELLVCAFLGGIHVYTSQYIMHHDFLPTNPSLDVMLASLFLFPIFYEMMRSMKYFSSKS